MQYFVTNLCFSGFQWFRPQMDPEELFRKIFDEFRMPGFEPEYAESRSGFAPTAEVSSNCCIVMVMGAYTVNHLT